MKGLIDMRKYLLKHVLYMLLTLFLVATITFFLMKLMPGTPYTNQAKMTASQIEIMNKQYGKAAKLLEDLNFLVDSISKNQMEKTIVKAVYYYASAMDKLNDHNKAMNYINLLFDNLRI